MIKTAASTEHQERDLAGAWERRLDGLWEGRLAPVQRGPRRDHHKPNYSSSKTPHTQSYRDHWYSTRSPTRLIG